jgi:hypothetical protein
MRRLAFDPANDLRSDDDTVSVFRCDARAIA